MKYLILLLIGVLFTIFGIDYSRLRHSSLIIHNYVIEQQGNISNSNQYVRYQQFLEECKEVKIPNDEPTGGYDLCEIDPCNEICFKEN